MAIGWILKCISGPRLYRVYKTDTFQGKIYEANCLEGYSDNIIRSLGYALSFAWSLGALASPLIAYFLYRKGIVGSLDVVFYLSRLARIIVVVWVGTLCLRGIGRCANTDYLKFLAALEKAQKDRLALKIYDGDFDAWPVDFSWSDVVSSKEKAHKDTNSSQSHKRNQGVLSFIRDLPVRIIGYLCIHSFGRSMMYPGAVKLFQAAVGPMLLEGRAKLMEQHRATRYKLATRDGNFIDSVFVDRRSNNLPQGKTLVLCCEGNAGFYEVGIMATPVDAQYSVLGWNHPGFAGSTGVPFPAQEQNAVDVVMQFAIHKLGFRPEDIIVYSWSIGAYTGSWCAMNYPDIKGLILDATFDDVVPLAASKMPSTIRGIVERTVADYFNLNNAEQTNKYTGPILMYRRTNDEVISTDINNRLGSNRANDLLTKVLRHRFPEIICDETAWVLREWLSGDRSHQKILYEEQHVDDAECERLLMKAIQDGDSYPMKLGAGMPFDQRAQLLLYIARRHMFDFNSTHCVPLPVAKFQEPWDIRKIGSSSATFEDNVRSSSSDSDFCRIDQEMCEGEKRTGASVRNADSLAD